MGHKVVTEVQASDEDVAELRAAIARGRVRQGVIADAIGVSEGHLSHLLNGRKTLSEKLAQQIAAAIEAATAQAEGAS